MALGYLLSPALQVENINGKPLVGGTITVYRHGTTNPYITYKDFTGDRNPADVVLNNKGMAVILADPNLVYDVYCRDADGVEQWSRLNVTVADPIGAGDGRIYNITSEDGSITSTSSVDVQTGVTTFDLSLTNSPDATLTVRHEGNRDGTYDTLGTFTATGPNKTITVPKEAYSFRMGNRSCFYDDVLSAYLTDKPVFAYEVYSWYEQGHQKEDLYQYMAMKQYWGDNNFYDGTANIQFVRIDVERNKIVMAKCLPEYPGSITGYATWEKTELPLDGGAGVFYVEYGTTTFADAEAAYLAGKTLVCREIGQTLQQTRMDDLYFLIYYMPTAGTYTGHFVFSNITGYIQTNVHLTPSATYEKTMTTLATRQEVMDTLAAEIAPDYMAVVNEYTAEDKFPIPAGTIVTYNDNTSSSVLQYLYKSKVAIERPDAYTSDPITAPQKWDKIHISDTLGTSVFYAEICVTPFDEIKAAYDRGDVIMGKSGSDVYPLYSAYLGTSYSDTFSFACLHGNVWYLWTCYQNSTGYEATNGWATPPGMVFFPERANIADEYSNQRTYAVGDLCYNGSLYRCTTAIDVPENWTAAHWTATSINAELADIRSGMSGDKVFHAMYGTTTFAEITDAVTAGKLVFLTGVTGSSDTVYSLTTYTSPRPSMAIFHAAIGNTVYMAKIDSGTWSTGSTTLATSADLANYQEKLTAGSNITIDANNVISATAAPQQQADWNQTDSSAVDYIKNKPDVDDVVILNYGTATLSQIGTAVNAGKLVVVGRSSGGRDYYGYLAEYASGAYSFVYKDRSHLVEMRISPDGGDGTWSMTSIDIPTVDQTYDGTSGHAQSGVAIAGELANYTPTSGLATVATTGDYDDLSNKPSIPTIGTITV